MDGWVSVAFVLIPALLIFLLVIAVNLLDLPQWLPAFGLLLYFIVPTLMLRLQFELSWKGSCTYGGVVFAIATLVDLVVSFVFAGPGRDLRS